TKAVKAPKSVDYNYLRNYIVYNTATICCGQPTGRRTMMAAVRYERRVALRWGLGSSPGAGPRGANPRVCGWMAGCRTMAGTVTVRRQFKRHGRIIGCAFCAPRNAGGRLLCQRHKGWRAGFKQENETGNLGRF